MGHMLADEVEELRPRLESAETMRELLVTGRDAARDFASTLSEHNLVTLEIQAWCARVDAALWLDRRNKTGVRVKQRLLDLFCGAGGCAKGYQRAGFYVVGVDNLPQPRYSGDEFVQGDALEYLREQITTADIVGGLTWRPRLDRGALGFDAIHASPPCPRYSSVTGVSGDREDHPDLIGPDTRRRRRSCL